MLSKELRKLLRKAEEGELVDLAEIRALPISSHEAGWAIDHGSVHADSDVRKLAAGVLLSSDFVFSDEERDALIYRMKHDSDLETSVLLACALTKRNIRFEFDGLINKASENPVLQGLLRKYTIPASSH